MDVPWCTHGISLTGWLSESVALSDCTVDEWLYGEEGRGIFTMGPFSILLRWELTLPPWGRLFASRAQRQAPVTVITTLGDISLIPAPNHSNLGWRLPPKSRVVSHAIASNQATPCSLHTGE